MTWAIAIVFDISNRLESTMRMVPHYIENTGSEDLVFLEMFRSPKYHDVSLNQWLANLPPELVQQHLSLPAQLIALLPKTNDGVVPKSG